MVQLNASRRTNETQVSILSLFKILYMFVGPRNMRSDLILLV